MTSRAVLGFVIVHRDLEHVVAPDANAMDFGSRLVAWLSFTGVGRGRSLRFTHGRDSSTKESRRSESQIVAAFVEVAGEGTSILIKCGSGTGSPFP